MPLCIVFSGLPGTGKTTVAKPLAQRVGATYLRVDSIEMALIREGIAVEAIGGHGYAVCCAVARDNLLLGNSVVVDMVNPLAMTRRFWSEICEQTHATLANIELFCSDESEHKKRISDRQSDIVGHILPTWEAVVQREYEPWTTEVLQIDTAANNPNQSLELIVDHLAMLDPHQK